MSLPAGWSTGLAGGGLAAVGALAGVIITVVFNVWNKHIDAGIKEADRRHERALDYEKWARQAKSDALIRLISGCRFVKWQAQWNEDDYEIARRAATMTALDQFKKRIGDEDGISEVMAYAAEPVRQALEEVLEQVNVLRAHGDELVKLRRVGMQIDAVTQQPVTDDSGAELKRALWSQQGQALDDAIGRTSDLNVDKVIALCDKVIDAARKDLQGPE